MLFYYLLIIKVKKKLFYYNGIHKKIIFKKSFKNEINIHTNHPSLKAVLASSNAVNVDIVIPTLVNIRITFTDTSF